MTQPSSVSPPIFYGPAAILARDLGVPVFIDGDTGERITQTWNRWAPGALHSPLAPAYLVEAYNRWQPDQLKIRRGQL